MTEIRDYAVAGTVGTPGSHASRPTARIGPGGVRRTRKVTLFVNGQRHEDEVEPRLLLVHYLRDRLGLSGTKIGCDTSNCGACTVYVDDHTVKSCSVLAVQADGCVVTTIEGLARAGEGSEVATAPEERAWHPVQRAFHTEHGLQCGYCTPGMVMATIDVLRETPAPTDEDIRRGLEGNLCRCTGYTNILKAVNVAAAELRTGAPSARLRLRSLDIHPVDGRPGSPPKRPKGEGYRYKSAPGKAYHGVPFARSAQGLVGIVFAAVAIRLLWRAVRRGGE